MQVLQAPLEILSLTGLNCAVWHVLLLPAFKMQQRLQFLHMQAPACNHCLPAQGTATQQGPQATLEWQSATRAVQLKTLPQLPQTAMQPQD